MKCDTCGKPITYRQEYVTFLRGMCDNDNGDEILAAHKYCGARPLGKPLDFLVEVRSSPASSPHTWFQGKAILPNGPSDGPEDT